MRPAPARCAKYSAMTSVGTLSAVARVRVIDDIKMRFGRSSVPMRRGEKRSLMVKSFRSEHFVAAIDDDGLAGDEVRIGRGEKDHRAGEIVGMLLALEAAHLDRGVLHIPRQRLL